MSLANAKTRVGQVVAYLYRNWWSSKNWWSIFSILLVLAGSWLSLSPYHTLASPGAPNLTIANQITHDGLSKRGVYYDGSFLYVEELSAGRQIISKIVPATGESMVVATPFPEARVLDVSPDRASLLASPVHLGGRNQELWAIPLNSARPQRVGEVAADDAAWSPDGENLVFVKGSDIYIAARAGTPVAKLASVVGEPFSPRFSPDGGRIRFSVGDVESGTSSLWEMESDGSKLHELLPRWSRPQSECCGIWTADGRYYIFQASQDNPTTISSLWALEDFGTQADGKNAVPIRLTRGPMSFGSPWPSDHHTIWALGVRPFVQVVKYDIAQKNYSEMFFGISATDLDFSPDGKWVSYITIPDGQLWKSRTDGSDRLQLTFPPDHAALPHWAPDSKQIAYVKVGADDFTQIMLISANGGNPEPVWPEDRAQVDANWSADGTRLLFGYLHAAQETSFRLVDLKTHTISTILCPHGVFSPRWSPDGRYIAALSSDFTRLMLFDFSTQKWSNWMVQAARGVNYPTWSSDSKYVYFDDMADGEESIRRIRVGETYSQRVFVLPGFDRYTGVFGPWSARAPDGSWIFVRDRSTQEVYSLSIELPNDPQNDPQ